MGRRFGYLEAFKIDTTLGKGHIVAYAQKCFEMRINSEYLAATPLHCVP